MNPSCGHNAYFATTPTRFHPDLVTQVQPIDFKDGETIDAAELARLARESRIRAKRTQEQTAELLSKTQPQISLAEKGDSRYIKTCIEMIEAYTDYEVEGPTFKLCLKPK